MPATLVKLRTSWPLTQLVVMATVLVDKVVVSASLTVSAVLIAAAAPFSGKDGVRSVGLQSDSAR